MADEKQVRSLDERIRTRAHAIWEAEGRPEGMAEQHWRRAEAEVAATVDTVEAEALGGSSAEPRQDELLDEALEETFPSSDPISPKHIC